MDAVAIIPARAGSKGVPGKNLRMVNGRSLLARTIEAAFNAAHVDHVVVSTESARLAAEASRFGAEVVKRPDELADDTASSEVALLHALDALPPTDLLAFLQCTSPFTRGIDIDRVVAPVRNGQADVAFAVTEFHGFVWSGDPELGAVGVNHQASSRPRRQDRPTELLETGAVYAMRADGFRQAGHRFFGRLQPVPLDPARTLEIDTPDDLEVARALAPLLDEAPASLRLPVPHLVALDFDGVLTDNRVVIGEDGREAVTCHQGDGHGLARLTERIPVVVLSTERNPVAAARCEKLGLPYEQGLSGGKEPALRRWAEREGIDLVDVLYVGNDADDLGCLQAVGIAVAVEDAVPEVKAASDAILSRCGGDGAVRELADALLAALDRERHP